MNRLNNYLKEAIVPYLGPDPIAKATKYLLLVRTIYFFSAGSALLIIYRAIEEAKEAEKKSEEVKVDEKPAPEQASKKGHLSGVVVNYKSGMSLTSIEFDKNKIYEQLDKEAAERGIKEVTNSTKKAT